MNKVKLHKVQSGSHLIKATQNGVVIFEEIVQVKPGELSTVFITKGEEKNPEKEPEETTQGRDLRFRQRHPIYGTRNRIIGYSEPFYDYSKEMNEGWFFKLAYMTNIYQSTQTSTLDRYASTLGLGLGFHMPIAPRVDLTLMLERGEFSSQSTNWFYMPLTANIQFSYLPSPYFGGKQYYGLGLGYYMTNLKSALAEDLTTVGYHFYYGLEMPAGPDSSLFFDFGYQIADISQKNYLLSSQYVSGGYRFFIDQ